ncbi:MAG: nickel-responsive transcriptional regulator NikR [Elusimicrobia bacterium HGW-Elusimicrobia-1]|jgi:CopG family nickel-responsive transcriptional regulator|nr:MAG: nickel-responsive transcriptional regulator NikR [Elusimicrobia bacterium HGW-Elusimicrobia-1]
MKKIKNAAADRLVRFSVSLEQKLLNVLDSHVRSMNYPTRSEALRDLIKEIAVDKEWTGGARVAAVATIVYDHHRHAVVDKLLEIQHDAGDVIISSQHVHLDCDNCLEIIAVRGPASKIKDFFRRLKTIKGIKHASLSRATLGSQIP